MNDRRIGFKIRLPGRVIVVEKVQRAPGEQAEPHRGFYLRTECLSCVPIEERDVGWTAVVFDLQQSDLFKREGRNVDRGGLFVG
jgi:hypothetical protein